MKRGRKSAASLAVVPVSLEARRPPPPEHLDPKAADVWRNTVSTMPGGWFDRAQEPILSAYCRHVVSASRLTCLVDGFEDDWLREDGGLQRLDKLMSMRERESRAVVMCARAMRLTQQAQMHPRSAGRAVVGTGSDRRPWDTAEQN